MSASKYTKLKFLRVIGVEFNTDEQTNFDYRDGLKRETHLFIFLFSHEKSRKY